MKKTIVAVTTAAALVCGAAALVAQGTNHVVAGVKDAQWGPEAPFLPDGT
jgi:hypothetical protein